MLRTIEIIGGGYDYLANVTSLGMLSIEKATLIIHPKLMGQAAIRRVNKTAHLMPYAESEDPVTITINSTDPGVRPVIILEDGIASSLLLASVKSKGYSCNYYPTIPLWQAACQKAGILFPENGLKIFPDTIRYAKPKASSESQKAHCKPDPLLLCAPASYLDGNWMQKLGLFFPSGTVDVIGFDGKVIWPRRRLPLKKVSSFAAHLPSSGRLIIVSSDAHVDNLSLSGLAGRGILITRSIDQADELGRLLQMSGATPFYFPTIEIAPPESWIEIDKAIDAISSFDGIILTSVNAVTLFTRRLRERGLDTRNLYGCKIFAVGEKTAEALSITGIHPDEVPQDYSGEGLVELLERTDIRGQRFLLPRAEVARELLPEKIRAMGGSIEVATLYRTVPGTPDTRQLTLLYQAGLIDAVVFTSTSTFKYFREIVGMRKSAEILNAIAIACIGPVTASVVKEAGFHVSAIPARYTIEHVITSLENFFNRTQ